MSKTLDRLQAVVEAATPGPWDTSDHREWLYNAKRQRFTLLPLYPGRAEADHNADVDLIVQMRNTYPEALAVVRAARFVATRDGEPIDFYNLPDQPTGPDLLDAIAAYLDHQDDAAEARGDVEVAEREVQADIRRWADDLRRALAAFDEAATRSLP